MIPPKRWETADMTHSRSIRLVLLLACGLLAAACGGGGGGDDDDSGGGPDRGPSLAEMQEASRFLAQATLGASYPEIERVARRSPERWLDDQLDEPPSLHLPLLRALEADYADPANEDLLRSPIFRRFAWWERAMEGDDLLRQRVALALSEILVVSDVPDLLFLLPECVASYYDLLLEHSFGDFEELLLAVSLHPAMGIYLSHLNNERGDPDAGRFPDENYAREVMQLFSIGLIELERDGRPLLNADGETIATYGNREITEMAKVFTGLGLQGSPSSAFGAFEGDFTLPMVMYDGFHEPGPKELLDGFVIPGGQPGMADVEDAVAHLANHPNTGPFLALRLIQRLVTSNPSPAYVERIATVFEDDGRGRRGNLGAVVRAILLDREARDPADPALAGRLREPFLRWASLLRAFDARSASGHYFIDSGGVGFLLGQQPLSSPSVFNFFQPDFAPNGPVRDRGAVAPEFQITTASTSAWLVNLMTWFSFGDPVILIDRTYLKADSVTDDEMAIRFDWTEEIELAQDLDALIDRFDLIFTYGTLGDESRRLIREAAEPLPPELRVPMVLHLLLITPDYAVVE
jgi:uncharacterized protein (DUF1800 family)